MAATTNINRYTGAAGSETATALGGATKLQFSQDDSNTGTTKIAIPTSAGTTYSQEVVLGLGVTVSGGTISNRKLSWASALPTGMNLFVKTANDAAYVQGTLPAANNTTNAAAPTGYGATALGTTPTTYDATSAASAVTTNTTANGAWQRVALGVDNTCTSVGTVALPNLQLQYDEA